MTPRRTGRRTPSLIARRLMAFACALQLCSLLAVGLPTLRLISARLPAALGAVQPGFLDGWMHDCLFDIGVVLLMSMLAATQMVQFAVGLFLSGPMTLLSRLMERVAKGDFSHVADHPSRDELGRYLAKAGALIAPIARGAPSSLHWEGEAIPFVRLAFFLVIFADAFCYAFLPVLARDLSAAPGTGEAKLAASLPVSVFWLAVAIVQLAAGARLPANARKGAFLAGIVILAIGLEGCAAASGLSGLIVGRAICGVGVGLCIALTQEVISAGLGPNGRSYAFAVYLSTYFAGAVCGTAIGSIVADHAKFQVTLLIASGLALAAIPVILPARFATGETGFSAQPRPRGELRRLLRNGRFLSVALWGAIPSRLLMSALLFYLMPLYLAEIGTSKSEIARVIMVYSLIMTLAGPPLGRLADLIGRPLPLVLLGMLLSAAAPLIGLLLPTPAGIGLALGLMGTAQAFGLSSQVSLLFTVTAVERREAAGSAAIGLYHLAERIGIVAGPPLVALFATHWDYSAAMIGIGAATLAGAALMALTFALAGGLRKQVAAAALLLALLCPSTALAAPPLKVALAVALTNNLSGQGEDMRPAAEMAREDTNADPALNERNLPPVALEIHDDGGTPEGAETVAREISAGDALAVIGPIYSSQLVATAPVYSRAGLAALSPTAHIDRVEGDDTTFHGVYSTETMGEAFADYLRYALDLDKAMVLMEDDSYGRSVADGFQRGARRLNIAAKLYAIDDPAKADALAARLVTEAGGHALILATLQPLGVALLTALHRSGWTGPVIATDTIAHDNILDRFRIEAGAAGRKSLFVENLYVAAPVILDNANSETLSFAERFEARYHHLPDWEAVNTYESSRVLFAAVRLAAADGTDLAARRRATREILARIDGPQSDGSTFAGPPWFDARRWRHMPVRIGRFHDGHMESASLQLIPVPHPEPEAIANGSLMPTADGYAQRQLIVYAGLHLNSLSELDTAHSTFQADFYVWLRYGKFHRPNEADPLDIDFPDLVGQTAQAVRPAEDSTLPDGTVYRLLHVRGTFRSDFDLHDYPFDSQTLQIRFFNGRAAADHIIYAVDHRAPLISDQLRSPDYSLDGAESPFRNLTEWEPVAAAAGRHVLVADSALGDPRLAGTERRRELSGFGVTLDLKRRVGSVLAKILLPLTLMTMILLASHFFTGTLEHRRVDVAITGVLSGAVLLTAINSELGGYGYTMEVEYIFYIFFFLCFLSITAAAASERLSQTGHAAAARGSALFARYVSLVVVVATVGFHLALSLK